MSSLVTKAAVKTALAIDGTGDDDRIDALIEEVSAFAEEWCGRLFDIPAAERTELFDGSATPTIRLPRTPITAVASVHESTDVPRVYDATTLLTAEEDYVVDEARGFLRKHSGVWTPGFETVQVVYTAGWADTDSVPAHLRRAVEEMISVKLEKGRGKLYHVKSETKGDGAIDYSTKDFQRGDLPLSVFDVLSMFRVTAVG